MTKNDFNKIKKIIIFSPNWIGDTVMSMPLANALRDMFPSAYIVVVAKPYVSCLWKTNDFVNAVWDFDAPGIYNFPAYLKFFRAIARRQFDLAVILPLCFRYVLFTFLAGIPYRIGYNVVPRRFFLTHALDYGLNLRSKHMVDDYLDILRIIGIKPEVKEPLLNIDLESEARASDILSKHKLSDSDLIIGIAPGAIYGKAKRWPEENYAELSDCIIEKYNAKILILAGPMERELKVAIKNRIANNIFGTQIFLFSSITIFNIANKLIHNNKSPKFRKEPKIVGLE